MLNREYHIIKGAHEWASFILQTCVLYDKMKWKINCKDYGEK